MTDAAHDGSPVRATLDRWRACGADRTDPVRFHLIDALERRAAGLRGEARRLVDERLSRLVAAYADTLAETSGEVEPVSSGAEPVRPLAGLASFAGLSDYAVRGSASATSTSTYPTLDALDYFREIWSTLSTEQQMRQSLAQLPGNAGPLNSNSLVHRSLSMMRELSPGYLQQFLSYVDALSWLEQLNGGSATTGKDAPRAGAAKKTGRAKAR